MRTWCTVSRISGHIVTYHSMFRAYFNSSATQWYYLCKCPGNISGGWRHKPVGTMWRLWWRFDFVCIGTLHIHGDWSVLISGSVSSTAPCCFNTRRWCSRLHNISISHLKRTSVSALSTYYNSAKRWSVSNERWWVTIESMSLIICRPVMLDQIFVFVHAWRVLCELEWFFFSFFFRLHCLQVNMEAVNRANISVSSHN